MANKFVIVEAWIVDKEGNRLMELKQYNLDDIFMVCVDNSSIIGGEGKSIFNETWKCGLK